MSKHRRSKHFLRCLKDLRFHAVKYEHTGVLKSSSLTFEKYVFEKVLHPFKRLFENGINEQQLEVEFKKWSGPKDSAKYVDLCFKRGKSIVEKCDLVLKNFQQGTIPREYYEKIDRQLKKGLDFFKMGVDISKEINYNLKFEQMMDYGHLLLRGPYSSMSLPQSCVLLPNEQRCILNRPHSMI